MAIIATEGVFIYQDLPRNVMGKVTKAKVKELFLNQDHSPSK